MSKITQYLDIILEGKDLSFDQAKACWIPSSKAASPRFRSPRSLRPCGSKGRRFRNCRAGILSAGTRRPSRNRAGQSGRYLRTGGATVKTFNVSTAAALVAAGAGSMSPNTATAASQPLRLGRCLTELGVNIAPGPEIVAECIRQARIGFMFAPKYHPAMKHVQPIRQSLDFRTAFNILGRWPIGRSDRTGDGGPEEGLMGRIAETLKRLGVRRAMVVHSNGLDEISTMARRKSSNSAMAGSRTGNCTRPITASIWRIRIPPRRRRQDQRPYHRSDPGRARNRTQERYRCAQRPAL